MAKLKMSKKSTAIDMTAMCDVAFLLLTFFILTATARVPEPLTVDTPNSTVKDKLPENNSGLFLCSGHEKTLFVCHRKHHEWFRSPQLQRVVGISHWMQIKPPEAD